VMAQVGCIHGDGGGILLQVAHDLRRCCGVPTSASTSQICDAQETWRAAPLT
jgi:hypothetical protein